MQLIERQAAAGRFGERSVALLALAIFDDVPRLSFVRDLELVASVGYALQSENFDGRGRTGLLDGRAVIVKHRADFSVNRPDDEDVADVQGAVLH